MYLWTEQVGYPLISVVLEDDGSVIITQVKYKFLESNFDREVLFRNFNVKFNS